MEIRGTPSSSETRAKETKVVALRREAQQANNTQSGQIRIQTREQALTRMNQAPSIVRILVALSSVLAPSGLLFASAGVLASAGFAFASAGLAGLAAAALSGGKLPAAPNILRNPIRLQNRLNICRCNLRIRNGWSRVGSGVLNLKNWK